MNADRFILLVEDNPDDQLLTRSALERSRLANDIIVVEDGAVALDFLLCAGKFAGRDPERLPQLVLLDLKLPKVDGIEVLRRLRENPRTRRLPVVVLTSSKAEADLVAAYDGGCNSYVRKPVDFTDFSEVARQLGLYWLLVNEAPRGEGG